MYVPNPTIPTLVWFLFLRPNKITGGQVVFCIMNGYLTVIFSWSVGHIPQNRNQ